MSFKKKYFFKIILKPSNFTLGLPSLAYDIFLYKSKTKIQLLSDVKKLKFFEDGIRGGLSFASEQFTDTRKSGKTMFNWVRLFFQYKKHLKYEISLKYRPGCE